MHCTHQYLFSRMQEIVPDNLKKQAILNSKEIAPSSKQPCSQSSFVITFTIHYAENDKLIISLFKENELLKNLKELNLII